MKIQKFDKLNHSCALFEAGHGDTNDVVSQFEECEIFSNLLNKDINSVVAGDPKYIDLSLIDDLRGYICNAIVERAKCSFMYMEAVREYNDVLVDEGYSGKINITPDGLFAGLDEYSVWQKNYFKHPIFSQHKKQVDA